MGQGHVFVVLGNLLNVNCDAWLLPTDSRYSLSSAWTSIPGLLPKVKASRSIEFSAGRRLAEPVIDWDDVAPLPILTAVPLQGFSDATELGPAIDSFIATGAKQARLRRGATGPFAGRRPLPLLAMPSFGTGGGGGDLLRGDVLRVLLDHAAAHAAIEEVDIVLVFADARMFALAQVLRKPLSGWERHLGSELLGEARELATIAREGRLVPFMGAGVSMSAGAPGWEHLIKRLAAPLGLSQDELDSLTADSRNVLDQAAYLRAAYEDRAGQSGLDDTGEPSDGGFGKAIADAVNISRYGLAPALLASLRSDEAITLNYDELFETASRDAGDSRTIIPTGAYVETSKWLLKLHGTVTNPSTIVLTRDDYLGFNTSREALSAIVKATLITHHLLFVGFGLADDHFHQIIHDVRRALPTTREAGGGFATALTLRDDPLDRRLWQGQLNLIPMSEKSSLDGMDASARKLEIFLDALLAHATDNHSYLLASAFHHALTEEDRTLKQALLTLGRMVASDGQLSASAPLVKRLLLNLGWDEPPPRSGSSAMRTEFTPTRLH